MLNDKGADGPGRSCAFYIYACLCTNINYR